MKSPPFKSGDSCEGTAQQYGISLEQIYTINQWNAEKCKKLEVKILME
jgi:LysM repeat protein